MSDSISITKFIQAIRQLPSDAPRDRPSKWYRTQKEHLLGWLSEYHGPGAYGRKTGTRRDACYAYNHIVEPEMLFWLIKAARVGPVLVKAARQSAQNKKTLQAKSAVIRQYIGWEMIEARLWGRKKNAKQGTETSPRGKPISTLVMNIKRKYFAEILSIPRRKHNSTEYRDLSNYWLRRLDRVGPAPFNLRLLNGMLPPVPEAIVRVDKVVINQKTKEIELRLGKVLKIKHWDRVKEKPTR